MVYAVIRRLRCGGNEIELSCWSYKSSDYDAIYERMMKLTDGDHEISSDAASWCELATVGERYEFRESEIVMMVAIDYI